ncbi:hypothetical protein GA565_18320 [Rouxiella sp. S1S-2]|uniref:hypothetical protein n=1 Tax=Rouxiella sp. S1S-2 TaxID=2653856 RepID=UPI0012654422|nr:hypothetical protein [Rouxiella sp. S1S-2]KAB7897781.1 hypothetical protein GA565_18320 [Rouxiella sp. S1S-2]
MPSFSRSSKVKKSKMKVCDESIKQRALAHIKNTEDAVFKSEKNVQTGDPLSALALNLNHQPENQ